MGRLGSQTPKMRRWLMSHFEDLFTSGVLNSSNKPFNGPWITVFGVTLEPSATCRWMVCKLWKEALVPIAFSQLFSLTRCPHLSLEFPFLMSFCFNDWFRTTWRKRKRNKSQSLLWDGPRVPLPDWCHGLFQTWNATEFSSKTEGRPWPQTKQKPQDSLKGRRNQPTFCIIWRALLSQVMGHRECVLQSEFQAPIRRLWDSRRGLLRTNERPAPLPPSSLAHPTTSSWLLDISTLPWSFLFSSAYCEFICIHLNTQKN